MQAQLAVWLGKLLFLLLLYVQPCSGHTEAAVRARKDVPGSAKKARTGEEGRTDRLLVVRKQTGTLQVHTCSLDS